MLRNRSINLGGNAFQLAQSRQPALHQRRCQMDKLLIPRRQSARRAAIIAQLLEQTVALQQDAVIFHEQIVINRIRLRNLHIKEAAAQARLALDELQILRREHHRVQGAVMLLRSYLGAVQKYFLLPALLLTVLFDFYLMASAEAGIFYAHSHRLAAKLRQLVLRRGPVRQTEGRVKQGLQQICLALGVLPVKNVNHRGQLQLTGSIIAEIHRIKLIDLHSASAITVSSIWSSILTTSPGRTCLRFSVTS